MFCHNTTHGLLPLYEWMEVEARHTSLFIHGNHMLNASFTFLAQGLEHGNISSIRNKIFLIQLFDQLIYT